MDFIDKIEEDLHLKQAAPVAASPVALAAAPADPGAAPGASPLASAAAPGGTPAQATITHRTLLIHGYSASGTEFQAWKTQLGAHGLAVATIEIGNYISLNNEITLKDLGEAFDRALRYTPWSSGSKDDAWTFDAIVHSTGILVLRQWLTSDPYQATDLRSRVKRLKHLVGLAPATFGSPQGKQGQSWLGALVKGNKDLGPDFLNAGKMVLQGLELASSYTWNLAQNDLLCNPPMYGQQNDTPYVAVFIGNNPYSGVARLASGPGTDGTVRWAGCALNTRQVSLDFRRVPRLLDSDNNPTRVAISPWADGRLACPMLAVDSRNHGTILSDPDPGVVDRVSKFLLTVNSQETCAAWLADAKAQSKTPQTVMDAASKAGEYGGSGWQQFVFHVLDDHGDGVDDYNVQLYIGQDMTQSDDKDFAPQPLIADTYSQDASYRCFYVRLNQTMLDVGTDKSDLKVWVELIAASGTTYVDYDAYYTLNDDGTIAEAKQKLTPLRTIVDPARAVPNLVKLDLTNVGPDAQLFYPYTTTLVEITIEREPSLSLNQQVSELFQFWQDAETANPSAPA